MAQISAHHAGGGLSGQDRMCRFSAWHLRCEGLIGELDLESALEYMYDIGGREGEGGFSGGIGLRTDGRRRLS
jgi:hypothetical protein